MWTVGKLGRVVSRIASDDSDTSLDAAYSRMATAVLAGLFGPPMLALPGDRLHWQIWGSLALVAPLIALAQSASRRSFTLAASLGFAGAAIGATAAHWPDIGSLGGWLILVPIETAIILAAACSNFGGLFPLVLLFGLAIAERIGLSAAQPDAMPVLIFAPPAAVCVSLAARALDRSWRARLRRDWLRSHRHAPSSSEMYLWLDARGRVIEVGADLAESLQVDAERFSGPGTAATHPRSGPTGIHERFRAGARRGRRGFSRGADAQGRNCGGQRGQRRGAGLHLVRCAHATPGRRRARQQRRGRRRR